MDIYEQINSIEKEIRETPYHKATEQHIGKLRARLSRLKDKMTEESLRKGGGGGGGYAVKKAGDATIVLVGPPSTGKSTLLNKLTNAQSKVAAYAFTTLTVIPGMMEYKSAQIQILDVPGLIKGAEEGKGRGREVLSVVRGCDLLVIMTDPQNLDAFESITSALYKNGIRINQTKPEVIVEKKVSGGFTIHSNIKQDFSKETIKDIVSELGLKNAVITLKEKLDFEGLIDAFSHNRVYIPAIYVLNKSDTLSSKVSTSVSPIQISAQKGTGLSEFKEKIWEELKFLNVYLVRPDEEPSFNNPIVMKNGQVLYDVAQKLGSDFAEGKTGARIWGPSAKFPGQEVSLSTKVADGVQVRFV